MPGVCVCVCVCATQQQQATCNMLDVLPPATGAPHCLCVRLQVWAQARGDGAGEGVGGHNRVSGRGKLVQHQAIQRCYRCTRVKVRGERTWHHHHHQSLTGEVARLKGCDFYIYAMRSHRPVTQCPNCIKLADRNCNNNRSTI